MQGYCPKPTRDSGRYDNQDKQYITHIRIASKAYVFKIGKRVFLTIRKWQTICA